MASDDNWRSGPRKPLPVFRELRNSPQASNVIMRAAETIGDADRRRSQVATTQPMTSGGDHLARVRHRSNSVTDFHFHANDTNQVGAIEHTDRNGVSTRYAGQRGATREQQAEVTQMALHNAGKRDRFT